MKEAIKSVNFALLAEANKFILKIYLLNYQFLRLPKYN